MVRQMCKECGLASGGSGRKNERIEVIDKTDQQSNIDSRSFKGMDTIEQRGKTQEESVLFVWEKACGLLKRKCVHLQD